LNRPSHAKESTCFYTWMGDDGICRTVTKLRAEIDLAGAIENSNVVKSLFVTKKFPLLVDARHLKSLSKEARKHFSVNDRDTKITCFALIVKSPLSRIIGNFFISLNTTGVPARLFDSEQEAINWLKQYIQ
ncbi:MAG: DUF7793 family protein, partial [Bacteroidia bacterium]